MDLHWIKFANISSLGPGSDPALRSPAAPAPAYCHSHSMLSMYFRLLTLFFPVQNCSACFSQADERPGPLQAGVGGRQEHGQVGAGGRRRLPQHGAGKEKQSECLTRIQLQCHFEILKYC